MKNKIINFIKITLLCFIFFFLGMHIGIKQSNIKWSILINENILNNQNENNDNNISNFYNIFNNDKPLYWEIRF